MKPLFRKIALITLAVQSLVSCSYLNSVKANREFYLEKKWIRSSQKTESYESRKINSASPVMHNSLLISANSVDGVVAMDKNTIATAWRFEVPYGVQAELSISDNKLYVAGRDMNIYCLNANTGELIWKFNTKSENLSKPYVDSGVVYILSSNNVLYAIHAITGKVIWHYTRINTASFTIRGASSPVVLGDKLFLGFSDGFFLALNKADGSVVWERQLSTNFRFKDIDSSPVLDGNTLYIGAYDGNMYALDLSGSIIWQYPEGSHSSPQLAGDKIVYSTSNGKIISLDKKTGKLIWEIKDRNWEGIYGPVSVHKNIVMATHTNGPVVLYSLTDGRYLAHYDPGQGAYSNIVAVGKDEYLFISNAGNIHSFQAGWRKAAEKMHWVK